MFEFDNTTRDYHRIGNIPIVVAVARLGATDPVAIAWGIDYGDSNAGRLNREEISDAVRVACVRESRMTAVGEINAVPALAATVAQTLGEQYFPVDYDPPRAIAPRPANA